MTLDEFLENRRPFAVLSAQERIRLSSYCVRKTLADREVLFHEGEVGHSLYLVTDGLLRLDLNHPNGTRFMASLMPPGNMSDHELAADAPHPTTTSAMGPAEVYLVPKKEIKALMLQDATFMEACFRSQDESRSYLLSLFAHAVALRPEIRLARILLTFYKLFGKPDSTTLGYRSTSAAVTGVRSRQNTSKMIRRWKQEGVIDMHYAQIEILDPHKLCEIAGWNHDRWRAGQARRKDSPFSRIQ